GELLKWTESDLKAEVVRFQQPGFGVCMSLVIRWVKYQALSMDFWDDSKKGNKFIQTPHIRTVSKWDLSNYGPAGPTVTKVQETTVERTLSPVYQAQHETRQAKLEHEGRWKRDRGGYSPEGAMIEKLLESKKVKGKMKARYEFTSQQ